MVETNGAVGDGEREKRNEMEAEGSKRNGSEKGNRKGRGGRKEAVNTERTKMAVSNDRFEKPDLKFCARCHLLRSSADSHNKRQMKIY